MRSIHATLKVRKAFLLVIGIISCFVPTATCLPSTNAISPQQAAAFVKMPFVPPHIHKNMAKNPELSEQQRANAQKNLDKTRELTLEKHEQSLRSSVPVRVLERLAGDESLRAGCSDDVKNEVEEILRTHKARWPSGPKAKVSDGLKAVLDANPALWEGSTSQVGSDGKNEEKK